MRVEQSPIRRPLFDAPIYPGEDLCAEERGIPLPSNTIFATHEGKVATFGPDAYARYITTAEKRKKPLINELTTELVTHPSYIESLFSLPSQKDNEATHSLTAELLHELPEIINKSPILSERQATELLQLATSNKSELRTFAIQTLRNYVDTTMRIDQTKETIDLRSVTETQNRIVNLLYTLTLAGLQTVDKNIYAFMYDMLSFRTPILTQNDPQAGLFAIAGQAPEDATLAKAILLDQTAGLFEQLFATEEGEYAKVLVSAAEKSQKYTKPFIIQNTTGKQRDTELMDFFTHRYQKFGTYLEGENININEYYTHPLPFPENIIYVQSQKMWPLFLNLCSEVMMLQGKIKSPIVQFALPDGSLRYVAEVDGHSKDITKGVIAYALNETHYPPEVSNKSVIETFLTFTTPDIPENDVPEMKRMLNEKKQALLLPVRGINQSGVEIQYDNNHHIAASSLSVDQTGQLISLRMGNYSLHLRLSKTHELLDPEGHPLDLPDKTRLWWETVVLAPLKELVCPTREDGVLVAGTEDLTPEAALLKTKKVFLTRIGFLRKLPSGECFTPEQAIKTLEVLYPLPGIERLDLAKLNGNLGYTKMEGQYTYVLPKEKEKKSTIPVSIHTPHAFDDVARFMK